jgi:ATP-dependent DNA helicase RecQ
MGVDKKNVRTVLHFNISRSVEAFLQESGRGGRDSEPAYSVVLYDGRDRTAAQVLQNTDPRFSRLMAALTDRSRCVRAALMEAMGCPPVFCSGCDSCNGSRPRQPAGRRTLLNFFGVYPRRYSRARAAEILRGGKSRAELKNGDRHLFGYGSMCNWRKEEIEAAIECLLTSRELKQPRRGFWRGCVSPRKTVFRIRRPW